MPDGMDFINRLASDHHVIVDSANIDGVNGMITATVRFYPHNQMCSILRNPVKEREIIDHFRGREDLFKI